MGFRASFFSRGQFHYERFSKERFFTRACIRTIEYTRRKRYSGKSKWNFRSRLYLSKDWIIAFSGLPLIIMSVIGVFVSVVGFLYAMFIVVYAILGNPVQGWASIMIVILILGGLQMTMLGIIGEYLWRNFNESRRRPLYFIEKRTQKNPDE